MNYWEMLKAISPYDYSIKNKLANNTETMLRGGRMRKTDVSNRMERFKNVVVTYDKTTGYLYIDDEKTDEQLAIFYVQEEE